MIQLDKLTKKFQQKGKDVVAVNEVSLTVDEGQILSLIHI